MYFSIFYSVRHVVRGNFRKSIIRKLACFRFLFAAKRIQVLRDVPRENSIQTINASVGQTTHATPYTPNVDAVTLIDVVSRPTYFNCYSVAGDTEL